MNDDADAIGTLRRELSEAGMRIEELERALYDRTCVEEAVKGSEERYRHLAENAHDVLWVFDINLGHTYVSPSVRRLRGYTVEEAMQQSIEEVLAPESYAKVMELFKKGRRLEIKGERHGPDWSLTTELEMNRKDGSTVWVEATINLLYDEEGRIKGIMGINRDISERRQAKEELRKSRDLLEEQVRERTLELTRANERLEKEVEERRQAEKRLLENEEKYRMYFSLSDDVMFSWDNQFRITSISPNVERVLGYTQDELVGKSFDELSILEPEDMREAMENALSLLSGKKVYSSVYRFITKDGERKFGDLSEVPIIRQGRIMGIITVGRDMTKSIEMENSLQESEERYRATLQGMPDAVSIIRSEDSKYLYVNDAFSRITGYTAMAVKGKTPFDLELPATPEDLERLTGLIGKNESVDSLELRVRKKDSGVIDMLLATRPVYFSGEDCLVMVMTDLTAIKLVEQERNQLAIKAKKMECLGTLSTGIAHDFNNLLTTINGYTRMSMKEIQSPAREETNLDTVLNHLGEVRTAAGRARDLVNQIIDFSSSADKVFAPIDLSSTVRDSLKLLRPSLKSNVRVTEELSGSHMIMGDAGQIHQVVKNLCANAVYAMNTAGGELEVSLDGVLVEDPVTLNLDVPRGSYVRLIVRDTGSGMNSRVKDRIFDPYFTTKGTSYGKGMGLSIVHGIVKSHGGTVTCDSEPGAGACFSIFLPEIGQKRDDAGKESAQHGVKGTVRVLNLDDR